VASYFVVRFSVHTFSNGEQWEGFVLGWWFFGLPAAGVFTVLCCLIGWFLPRSRVSFGALATLLLLGALLTFGAAILGAAWGAGLIASQSNPRINAPHSVVTALAHNRKRRAAGRARYAQRWTGDQN
jgi:hypothetical protein